MQGTRQIDSHRGALSVATAVRLFVERTIQTRRKRDPLRVLPEPVAVCIAAVLDAGATSATRTIPLAGHDERNCPSGVQRNCM